MHILDVAFRLKCNLHNFSKIFVITLPEHCQIVGVTVRDERKPKASLSQSVPISHTRSSLIPMMFISSAITSEPILIFPHNRSLAMECSIVFSHGYQCRHEVKLISEQHLSSRTVILRCCFAQNSTTHARLSQHLFDLHLARPVELGI
jgi:hypothetical protein